MEDVDPEEIEDSRPPTQEEIVSLCRRLNEAGAKYVVVGGLAIQQAGYSRPTLDIAVFNLGTGTLDLLDFPKLLANPCRE